MTPPTFLPLAEDPAPERRDAARNRDAVLGAALRLVDEQGPCAVTMDDIAASAGVGKATVFRRFGSRAGLMTAVLDHTEAEWQAAVISGPPPLGPGAAPMDRLVAFGRTRMEQTLAHAELIEAAGSTTTRNRAAYSFIAMHVRHLLRELDVRGDVPLLATALLAPLEAVVLRQQVEVEGLSTERIAAAWEDVVRRVVAG
ncbi:AcrR family transcriptional regulator [Nocardioides daedukensis]|uniref:AcrR family transcriptional regulator n=1 Tax=Nocardioides daedukensis TaxID=634462 RepID=A0A7Y9S0G9_9ACTN|nr:AcrR family transcriptional regulator [Nocardioides daedukensis]